MRFLGLFIIICSILSLLRKKHTKRQNNISDKFWEKERIANQTRRQDIRDLPYITIPLEKFPIGILENDTIKECENILSELSEKRILNLGTQTNTDLKLAYGSANLSSLTEYEQNFTTLCQTLVTYASALLSEEQPSSAQTVLEYGISIGSDVSQNFLLLADIYKSQGAVGKIEELIATAEQLDSLMKHSILEKLNQKLEE
ncbi:MAG: hypothetical protein PUA75_04225 [Clostridiales bacterium]|nr:hypothetical protein [Clostridiales bacterium]